MLFNKPYQFKGKHAEMVIDLTASFDDKGNKLFVRNLDVYLLAPIIGFLKGRKGDNDTSGKTTNIFLDAMAKETTRLWFNYRLIMLLDQEHEPDLNMRIDKAFRVYGTDQALVDEDLYESYVRGGVEVLHEKLIIPAKSPEDYLKNLYEFMEEFEELYGQKTDEILDLVKLAKE